MRLGPALDAALAESIRAWARSGMVRRLWAKDAGVWTGGDEARWLGWLDVATVEAPLEALAALTRECIEHSEAPLKTPPRDPRF